MDDSLALDEPMDGSSPLEEKNAAQHAVTFKKNHPKASEIKDFIKDDYICSYKEYAQIIRKLILQILD